MNQIVVLSGKGGTGKTLLTAALGSEINDTVFADCDVETPNLSYLVKNEIYNTLKFESGNYTVKETDECNGCKKCIDVCRFNAIKYQSDKNRVEVIPHFCSGCEMCSFICPQDAIYSVKNPEVEIFLSYAKSNYLIYPRKKPGERATGKVVSIIRKYAEELAIINNKQYIFIDGAPGLGCPVIASVSNVKVALIVTEPTLTGIFDFKRLINLLKRFDIKIFVIINKFDINLSLAKRIEECGNNYSIQVIEKIPYISEVSKFLNKGKNYFTESDDVKSKINNINNILKNI